MKPDPRGLLESLASAFDGRSMTDAMRHAAVVLRDRLELYGVLLGARPGTQDQPPVVWAGPETTAPGGAEVQVAIAAAREWLGAEGEELRPPKRLLPESLSRHEIVLPIMHRGRPVGVLGAATGSVAPDHGLLPQLDLAVALLGPCLQLERLDAQLRLEIEERELLLETSRRVGRSLELQTVLDKVFRALARVVRFDAAAIYLAEGDGMLRVAAHRGYDEREAVEEVPAGRGIVGLALRQMRGLALADVRGHPDYLMARNATRSEMAVPIVSAQQAIGVINLESDRLDAFSDRDLRIAELVASQVASAIVAARLHRDRLAHLEVERELAWAREIQVGLFPAGPPATPRVQFDAVNVPSSAVGGDYYDHMLVRGRHLWLVLADVSGHGLFAALLTAVMQTGFRLLAEEMADPARLARRLNALLFERTPANQFVAGVFGLLDLDSGRLRYCNAGHIPPVVQIGDQQVDLAGGGLPLGMFGDTEYQEHSVQLRPGTTLLWYTDGIVEAENSCGESFGRNRLLAAIEPLDETPVAEVVPRVRQALRAFRCRRGEHRDDITLMVVRWLGGQPPAPASPA